MDKQTELKLLRERSIAGVIRDGYRLYTDAFRRLFRASWLAAACYALAFALMMGYIVNNVVPLLTAISTFGYDAALAEADTSQVSWLTACSALLFILAALTLASYATDAFRQHKQTGDVSRPLHWYGRLNLQSLGRTLLAGLWLLVIALLAAAVVGAVVYAIMQTGIVSNIWKSIASGVLLLIVVFLLFAAALPFCHTLMRRLLDEKTAWVPPLKGYADGLRHWGLLFATVFVVMIVTSVLTLVCELPAFIIAIANVEAYAGLAVGDPLGMPSYIVPMTYCVFAVAGFVQAYVHLSTLFPLYYAYGSIEQHRMARNEIKEA